MKDVGSATALIIPRKSSDVFDNLATLSKESTGEQGRKSIRNKLLNKVKREIKMLKAGKENQFIQRERRGNA